MKEGLLISAGELMQLTQEQKKDIIEILRNHTERYPAPKAVLERKENWTQEDAWEAELSFLQKALKEAGAPADLLMILEYILPVDHASRPDLIMLLKKKCCLRGIQDTWKHRPAGVRDAIHRLS